MNTTSNIDNGQNPKDNDKLEGSVSQTPCCKKWWESRTVWVNLTAIVAAITAYFGAPIYIDPELAMTLYPLILGIINLILRGSTDKSIEPPIHLKK